MTDFNNTDPFSPIEDPNAPDDDFEPKEQSADEVKERPTESIEHYVQPEVTESVVDRLQSELSPDLHILIMCSEVAPFHSDRF